MRTNQLFLFSDKEEKSYQQLGNKYLKIAGKVQLFGNENQWCVPPLHKTQTQIKC